MIEIIAISVLSLFCFLLLGAVFYQAQKHQENITILLKAFKAKDFVDMQRIDEKQPEKDSTASIALEEDLVPPRDLTDVEFEKMINKQLEEEQE